MGAGPSRPPPPPRVAKKLAGTTIQIQHLPPLIQARTKEGILGAVLARNRFLSGEARGSSSSATTETHDKLSASIARAHRDGCFRDYLVLLVEKSMFGLCTRSGVVPGPLLELARMVNPFLDRDREGAGPPDPDLSALQPPTDGNDGALPQTSPYPTTFRVTDLELVTGEERDLLVLLYYTHDMDGCADEAIDFISTIADRGLKEDTLARRREPFTETEIYTFWTMSYITSHLASRSSPSPSVGTTTTTTAAANPPQPLKLAPQAANQLRAESQTQVHRLFTICDMLLHDHRLDQICLLLQQLQQLPPLRRGADQVTVARVRSLARQMKKKRNSDGRDVKPWHVTYADSLVAGLRPAKERLGWRRALGFAAPAEAEAEAVEMGRMKKD